MSDFLKEYRAKYPEYNDIPDDKLVGALHLKYNNDAGAELTPEEFYSGIGYNPEPLRENPDIPRIKARNDDIPVQEAGQVEKTPVEPEKEGLGFIGATKNIVAGAGEVAGDLASQIPNIGKMALDAYGKKMFGDELYEKLEPVNVTSKILEHGSDELKGIDLGYEEQTSWEDVKDAFSEGGAMSGSAYAEAFYYGLEHGGKSAPHMAAVMVSLPAYVLARSGEIGQERALNKGKKQADLTDVLEAAPFAIGSALLERIGVKGMTTEAIEQVGKEALKSGYKHVINNIAGSGIKGASKEATTEFIQEGMLEYVGEKFGTDAEMSFADALDRGLAGVVSGGVVGASVATGTASVGEVINNPEKEFQADVDNMLDNAAPFDPETASLNALKPERAQMSMGEMVNDYAEKGAEHAQLDRTSPEEQSNNEAGSFGVEQDLPEQRTGNAEAVAETPSSSGGQVGTVAQADAEPNDTLSEPPTREEALSKAAKYYEKTKAPLINIIRANGGVKIGSDLAAELEHMGINQKTHPFFFKKDKGLESTDYIEVGKYDILEDAQVNENGELDKDWFLERISDENAGIKYYPPSVKLELDAANEEAIQEELYAKQLEEEANIEISEEALPIDDEILSTTTGFIEGLDNDGFEWNDTPTGSELETTKASAFEPETPPFETEGSSETGSTDKSSVEEKTGEVGQPSELHQKSKSAHKELLEIGPPKHYDEKQQKRWIIQQKEILENPDRYHVTKEYPNKKGLKVGDKVLVNGKVAFIQTMMRYDENSPVTYNVSSSDSYGGMTNERDIKPFTEARTEPKQENTDNVTKKTEAAKTVPQDQQEDMFGGITSQDQKGFAENQSNERKKSKKKQNDDTGELFDTEGRKQTDIEDKKPSSGIKAPKKPTGDWRGTSGQVKKYTVNDHHKFQNSLGDETATVESILEDAKKLIADKEVVLEELKKLKKAELAPIAQSMRGDLTKPEMVKEAYNTMLRAHVMGSAVMTIFGGSKSFEEQIIEQIENQTQKDVDSQYEEQAKYRAQRKERMEFAKKASNNPETLAEFKHFIKYKGKGALSPDQLAAYDELVSDTISEEKAKPEVIKGDTDQIKTERAQTVHSKSGIDLYVVKLVDRIGKDKFKELSSKAKQFGGYYSRYSRDGAIPGYQFKTSEDADLFENFLAGADVDKSNALEAKADIVMAKNSQKLLDMADKMEAKAEEEISKPRQTNTGKRASQAASSIDAAQKKLALAKTIREIAIRLQDGEIKHLSKISHVTQLEDLISIQRQAIPRKFFEGEYDGYGMSYELKSDVSIDDYIANVQFPELYVHAENMTRVAEKIKGERGFKNVARDIRRLGVYRNKDHLRVLDQKNYDKLLAAIKRGYIDEYDLGGFTADLQKTIKRLKRLGIETDEQLRAAIRELDGFRVKKAKADPIVKLEAALIGKKIPGYFPTPKVLVEKMIDYADIKEGQEVLEPSAGKGNIAAEIKAASPNAELSVIEFNSNLRDILSVKGFNVVGNDFLEHTKKYDRIVMNPPFENFQDIDHVQHAFELLKPGGKLVAIMGAGVKNSRKKAVEFRDWVENQGSYIEDLPEGSFKNGEVATGTSTVMVVLEKNDQTIIDRKETDKSYSKRPEGGQNINHAPGHNYVGSHRALGIPQRQEVVRVNNKTIRVPDKPQRIEPIMAKLVSIMGRRIYFGKIKGKSTEGFYVRNTGQIRTRAKNDVEVLAHEMAHYLDFYSDETLPNFYNLYMDDRYNDEVRGLSYTDNEAVYDSEGFAEFVRLYLTNSTEAKLRAPRFYDAFEALLKRDKKLHKKMTDLQELMHKFYFQGADKLGQALIGKDISFSQQFNQWAYRRDSRIRQQTIDRFHAARKIEQELTGKIGTVQESAWKQFRISNGGSEGIAEYILNYGTLNFDENGDLKPTGESLHDVFAPVKGIELLDKHKNEAKIDLLMRYFVGRRAMELHKQGRENLIPKETAMEWARLGGSYPVFESIRNNYQAFNDRMMDFYEEAGMITPEGRAAMQSMNKDYVPFNRIRDQLAGNGNSPAAGFKRLKGGTANLNDILVNIQDGIVANVRSALNNRAKQRMYQYISGHRDGAIFATRLGPDSKPVKVYQDEMMSKVGRILEQNGIMIEGELGISDPELLTFWQHGVKPTLNESGNMVDTVIINGKPKYFEVQDPLLQDMLLSMNPESYSSFMNIMFGMKNFFTRSITLGIEFMGANLVRDTAGASVISKEGFIPFIDSFKGMYSFITKDKHYQDFMRSGGGYSSRVHGQTNQRNARRRVKLEEFGVMNTAENLLSSVDNIASAFEYGTRIGEFRIAKKNNRSDMDAGFEAREISTDFSVLGANRFLTGWIRTVPFLNAMIQSQDRVYRGALVSKKYDGNPTAIAMKAFLGVTLPTLALYLINKEDDEYLAIPDYERRTNWHIPMGNGRFFKIPRPYDVGFVYGTMPELFFKYVEDEKGKEFADGLLWTMTQMYGVDATPAMMSGWWDLVRNEKWTGAPVVPSSVSEVSAPEQYTATTSDSFVKLGEVLGVSPVKAEHMFKAYTGYLGGYMLAGTDHLMWDEDRWGEKPEKDLSENPFLKRFITQNVRHSTAQMQKFFDLKELSDQVVADYKAKSDARRSIKEKTPKDKFYGLTDDEKKVLFGLNDSMNEIIKLLYGKQGIKTAELAIKYNPDLSGAEKREKMDNIWRTRNDVYTKYMKQAEQALKKAKLKQENN